jgi:predicted HicB family RNase H-like nuclease
MEVCGRDQGSVACAAAEEMVGLIHADGQEMPEAWGAKRFSGEFMRRVEPALHRRLAAKALAAGESLNSYCVKTLCRA